MKLKINSLVINESDTVELFGITTDNVLTFNEDLKNLCRVTYNKKILISEPGKTFK